MRVSAFMLVAKLARHNPVPIVHVLLTTANVNRYVSDMRDGCVRWSTWRWVSDNTFFHTRVVCAQ